MKIVVIGSGNVAWHLTKIFTEAGEEVVQVVSRTPENAKTLGNQFKVDFTDDFTEIHKTADLYVVAVSDNAIAEVAKKLDFVTSSVVHTSGSTDIRVLQSLSCQVGVFYPLQTFSKNKEVNFRNIPICLQASNNNLMSALHNLASTISDRVYEISSRERLALHLAAVFACNFSNHMMALAEHFLAENNISPEMLQPLIRETFEKSLQSGAIGSQTGPALRKDEVTILKHMELLQNNPKLAELYQMVSTSIQSFYK